jgi:hypothetical protein
MITDDAETTGWKAGPTSRGFPQRRLIGLRDSFRVLATACLSCRIDLCSSAITTFPQVTFRL